MFLFTFLAYDLDSSGVEYEDATRQVLSGTSTLKTGDYIVPSSCKTILGGPSEIYSSFRGSRGKLKTLSFEPNSNIESIYPFVFKGQILERINFSNCLKLKTLNESLCQSCTKLKYVTLPPSLTTICTYCFASCSNLLEIIIPDSVTEICSFSFNYCNKIATFSISETSNLKYIRNDALVSTNITSFYIPKNLQSIGGAVFLNSKVTAFTIHSENNYFSTDGKALMNKNNDTIYYLPNTLKGNYTVPETVKTIKSSAFRGTQFENIFFEGSIAKLSSWVFSGCNNIVEFTFPNGVKTVEASAMRSCQKLETVHLSSSITVLGENCFQNCPKLKNILLHEGIVEIRTLAFSGCISLETLDLPASLVKLQQAVFTNCKNLVINGSRNTNITIENEIMFTLQGTHLNEYFGSNTSITIPSKCTVVGDSALVGSSVTEVSFDNPDSLTIQSKAFRGTNISKITFPDTLVSIQSNAFENCKYLTEIDLGETQLEIINESSFLNCINLASFTPPPGLTEIKANAFYDCSKLESFDFFSTCIIAIGEKAFYNTGLSEVHFPSTLANLGASSFRKCSMTSLIFEQCCVQEIPLNCFADCSKMYTLELPNRTNKIGEESFIGCSCLCSFTLPSFINTVEIKAFYGCTSLTSFRLALNCSLETIKAQAFNNCPKLAKVFIEENDEKFKYDQGVLMDKNGTEIILFLPASSGSLYVVPAKVMKIKEYAFSGCTKLERVIIPDGNIRKIGVSAFQGCSKLKFLYLPKTLSEIGADAFEGCKSLRCGSVVINDDLKQSAINVGRIPADALGSNCKQNFFSCACKKSKSKESFSETLIFLIYSAN